MRIRKIAAAAVAAVMFFSICMTGRRPVRADSPITAREAVDEIGVGWNLGNTLDSYGTWITGTDPASFETAWGNPETTKAMIDSVKAHGFNAIRIPVTWAQHIDAEGNVDRAWMDRVKTVVDYAMENDLYVILNVHHDTGEHGGDKVCWIMADGTSFGQAEARYRKLWGQIATEFKDYGYKLMFEGYNEVLDINNTWNAPSTSDALDTVNKMAQAFVDSVRATGGNNADRNLIVNTYVSSVDQRVLDAFVLPSDTVQDHLIAEVHVYAPWSFTGTAASVTWTSVHSDWTGDDSNEVANIMNSLDAFSKRLGVPVIIGECGAEFKENDTARCDYAKCLVSQAASRGIKCFWWDNGDYKTSGEGGYAIFNRAAGTWNEGIVSALTGSAVSKPVERAGTLTPPSPTPTQVPGTEPSEPSSTPDETTVVTSQEETEVTETETSDTAETKAGREDGPGQKAGDDNEEKSGWSSGRIAAVVISGIVIVAAAYAGLFLLGLSRRKK